MTTASIKSYDSLKAVVLQYMRNNRSADLNYIFSPQGKDRVKAFKTLQQIAPQVDDDNLLGLVSKNLTREAQLCLMLGDGPFESRLEKHMKFARSNPIEQSTASNVNHSGSSTIDLINAVLQKQNAKPVDDISNLVANQLKAESDQSNSIDQVANLEVRV